MSFHFTRERKVRMFCDSKPCVNCIDGWRGEQCESKAAQLGWHKVIGEDGKDHWYCPGCWKILME